MLENLAQRFHAHVRAPTRLIGLTTTEDAMRLQTLRRGSTGRNDIVQVCEGRQQRKCPMCGLGDLENDTALRGAPSEGIGVQWA